MTVPAELGLKPYAPGHGGGWPFDRAESGSEEEPDRSPLPRISVVTPSFNQGPFIERTIRSVLLQGYPNLEYIVMDGGSTDESVNVIRHYADRIDHWQSEKDDGQSAAINAGVARATGDIVAWLNSDDYYLPGALASVARRWQESSSTNWVVGTCRFLDGEGVFLRDWTPQPAPDTAAAVSLGAGTPQPSAFWSRKLWNDVGGVDTNLHYCMDEDLWMRFYLAGARPVVVEDVLAVRFVQTESKTVACLPRFSDDFSRCLVKYRSCLDDTGRKTWRSNVAKVAERYGIHAGQHLVRGELRAVGRYLRSGLRLAPSRVSYGLLRGVGATLTRRCRGAPDGPGGQEPRR